MKQKKSFEELYLYLEKNSGELNEIYQEAKKERKKLNWITFWICLLVNGSFFLIAVYSVKRNPILENIIRAVHIVPMFLIMDIFIVAIISLLGKKQKKYSMAYKQQIMKTLIENFYTQLEYFPDKKMPSKIYNEGEYNESYNCYYSDDYFEAMIDENYLIDMAEVNTVNETRDSDGDTSRITKFHGLFAKIVLEKSIGCKFRIDRNSRHSVYQNRLEMDSSDFEKKFNVYTSNKIIGMQLLTPDIMEEILNFQNKTKNNFDIYIQENNLYLRFHCGPMFEVKSFKKGILDEQSLKEYYNVLEFIDNLSRKIIQVINETEI